ncbi:hypothetical protein PIIN_11041 [Serendipita indica DSM 11827]|uniref:Uncharacterized protein n=1 Tax=Serendipita indica (strain DSM 11827) TaxID=1109443 RepID=G4U0G3_SERID|nr:hypothetical protein PIIN_11041 [Serendipita indica DSM 11827]
MNPGSPPSDSRQTAHRLCLARGTTRSDYGIQKPALGAKANASDQDDTESVCSGLSEDIQGTPLRIVVPGFNQCSLSLDGWVHSSSKRLFWVPPDNRRGLKYPYRLTIPTRAPFRVTKLDFTNFQCGPSWTKVRTDACS